MQGHPQPRPSEPAHSPSHLNSSPVHQILLLGNSVPPDLRNADSLLMSEPKVKTPPFEPAGSLTFPLRAPDNVRRCVGPTMDGRLRRVWNFRNFSQFCVDVFFISLHQLVGSSVGACISHPSHSIHSCVTQVKASKDERSPAASLPAGLLTPPSRIPEMRARSPACGHVSGPECCFVSLK